MGNASFYTVYGMSPIMQICTQKYVKTRCKYLECKGVAYPYMTADFMNLCANLKQYKVTAGLLRPH